MKILQINNYHFLKGGSETVYLNTGKLLESKGHEVVYFSTHNEKNIDHGANEFFVKSANPMNQGFIGKIANSVNFVYSKTAYNNLKKLLQKEKPDIAHLHIFYGGLTSSILKVLKEFSIPVVMSVHEYKMLCPAYTFLTMDGVVCEKCAKGNYMPCVVNKCNKGNIVYSLIAALESKFRDKYYNYCRNIDHFIMVSKFIKDKHSNYISDIKEKSSVIYNFQNLSIEEISNKKDCDLVYFGRLSKEKGLLTLLKVLKQKRDVTLKIIGTGPISNDIEDYVRNNELDNVNVLGFQSGDDLWNHVKSSRFSVVPSEWYENNPMSVIESLFLGVPVIGANIGGIPEIVKEDHGYIFESGSVDELACKIDQALNLPEDSYLNYCKNAQVFAENSFSETHHYGELMEIYNSVLQ